MSNRVDPSKNDPTEEQQERLRAYLETEGPEALQAAIELIESFGGIEAFRKAIAKLQPPIDPETGKLDAGRN